MAGNAWAFHRFQPRVWLHDAFPLLLRHVFATSPLSRPMAWTAGRGSGLFLKPMGQRVGNGRPTCGGHARQAVGSPSCSNALRVLPLRGVMREASQTASEAIGAGQAATARLAFNAPLPDFSGRLDDAGGRQKKDLAMPAESCSCMVPKGRRAARIPCVHNILQSQAIHQATGTVCTCALYFHLGPVSLST